MANEPRRRRGQEAKLAGVRGTRYEDQFFKTKMCSFWEKGACTRGYDCKYAHGDKELNTMPNLTKTSLCRDLLANGVCSRPDCLFAHNVEELRATNEFYKTSMCSFFRVGQCKLGAACRHAHDPSELVDLPQKAITDDVEVRQMAASGRSRRGGRKIREKLEKILLADDDDLDTGSLFERMTTSPPSFAPQSPGAWVADATSTSASTAVTTASDEDDLDEVPDMWARMKTTPAPTTMVPMAGRTMGNSMIQNEVQAVPMTAAGPLQLCQNGMVMQQVNGTRAGADGPVMMVPMVFMQVPVQQGGYVDPSTFVRQISGTLSVDKEMEAKLLQNAMPDVYED